MLACLAQTPASLAAPRLWSWLRSAGHVWTACAVVVSRRLCGIRAGSVVECGQWWLDEVAGPSWTPANRDRNRPRCEPGAVGDLTLRVSADQAHAWTRLRHTCCRDLRLPRGILGLDHPFESGSAGFSRLRGGRCTLLHCRSSQAQTHRRVGGTQHRQNRPRACVTAGAVLGGCGRCLGSATRGRRPTSVMVRGERHHKTQAISKGIDVPKIRLEAFRVKL